MAAPREQLPGMWQTWAEFGWGVLLLPFKGVLVFTFGLALIVVVVTMTLFQILVGISFWGTAVIPQVFNRRRTTR